ncbi:RNA polymerase sigma factor [Ktedonospora formicarum]|uniref:RNA polymerase sigma factor n=1 Tax=Ktedonospora formicarum TaxID=2778364 RepID=A0A8J3IB79_9CHLR|nr:RNA polymerase sigma factor [Ktedonospora formicarum]GHO50693.1 RNA polymerase subunit sigma-24 [Ktedonospora formicarum]
MNFGEDDCIRKAAYGDQEAFRSLWETHHALAMATALRLCHHRPLAEEITQGAFVLAWRGLPRFQLGQPFRPWFVRILYRHALDVMERQRRYHTALSFEALHEDEQENMHVDMNLQEHIVQREEIRHVLAQLNADQCRVIALRYGADLTEEDIAHVLGWPLGTVKSRLNRARKQCRTLLLRERR